MFVEIFISLAACFRFYLMTWMWKLIISYIHLYFKGLLVSSNLFYEKNPMSWQHCLGSSVGKAGECSDVVCMYRFSLFLQQNQIEIRHASTRCRGGVVRRHVVIYLPEHCKRCVSARGFESRSCQLGFSLLY